MLAYHTDRPAGSRALNPSGVGAPDAPVECATEGVNGSTIAEQWAEHAEALADWTMARVAVRHDVYGAYTADGNQFTAHEPLTRSRLVRHYLGEAGGVVGLHSISTSNLCKSVAWDIDAHDEEADPEANWRFALAIADHARDLGLRALIFDSNGLGGYHVRVFFKKPIPAAVAYWLCQRLIADHAEFGFTRPPEAFPKQPGVTLAHPFGNWLRAPGGRHHKRDHWTRIYDPEKRRWLEGTAAARRLISVAGDKPDKILAAYQAEEKARAQAEGKAETEAEVRSRNGTKQGAADTRRSRDLVKPDKATVREALRHLPTDWPKSYGGQRGNPAWLGVGMALHSWDAVQGLGLWIEFSQQCREKFDEAVCREKWATFDPNGALKIGTIFHEAKRNGWVPPWETKGDGHDKSAAAPPSSGDGKVEADGPIGPNEAADDPFRLARIVLNRHNGGGTERRLVSFRGTFYSHDGAVFRADPNFTSGEMVLIVKAELDRQNIMAIAAYEKEAEAPAAEGQKGKPPAMPRTVKVTRSLVADVLQALTALTALDQESEPPFWIDPWPTDPAPANVLVARNGLVDLTEDTPRVLPHTPRLFATSILPYAYDPAAPTPNKWLKLLEDQWATDRESIDAIHEQFGYLITPDITQQRIMLWIGPPRSGRGTMKEVLTALVGAKNVASTSAIALAGDFGLEPLLGKTLAIMGDARLSDRHDSAVMLDRLLRISGRDPVEVNRKGRSVLPDVTMRVRFLILSNEVPNIRDASGAIVSRYAALKATREIPVADRNPRLKDEIIAEELPGILNLAIEGRRRLRQRGTFLLPKSATGLLDDAQDLASPIRVCVCECFEVHPDASIETERAFEIWKAWALKNGYQAGNIGTLGKDLKAAFPGIEKKRPRNNKGIQVCTYFGIGLKPMAF
jgi:P4 family phage/plasmid primase-like protien